VVKSAFGKSPMALGVDCTLDAVHRGSLGPSHKNVKDWHGCARSTFAVRAYVADNDPMGFFGEGCL